jgi:hypothetical protein
MPATPSIAMKQKILIVDDEPDALELVKVNHRRGRRGSPQEGPQPQS